MSPSSGLLAHLLALFLLVLLLVALQLALLLSHFAFLRDFNPLSAASPPCPSDDSAPSINNVERESRRIVAEDGKNDDIFEDAGGDDEQMAESQGVFRETEEEAEEGGWPMDLTLSHPLQCSCRFPLLQPTEPDLAPFVRHFRAVRCPPAPSGHLPLVSQLRSGSLLFGLPHRANLSYSSRVACFARELGGTLRPRVRRPQLLGNWTRIPINKRLDVLWDQFVVKCFLRNGENDGSSRGKLVFHDAFATIVPRPAPPLSLPATDLPLGISIFVIDSTARTQFLRHMPISTRFLRENRFRVMNGYTKVGDNSAINLLAVLAGMVFEPERRGFRREWFRPNDYILTDAQIRDPDRDFFAPLRSSIFRLAEVGGYATLWNDEIATSGFGLFHYNAFKGFVQRPAHHYFRPYYEYLYQHLGASSGCVNGEFVAPRYIDLWERFASKYGPRPQLAFTFLTGLTHASANNIELLDGPLSEAMGRLKAAGHLERNIVILMGDHGQRISQIQRSRSGRVEERMPMLTIGVPEAFELRWPELARRLSENQNRLTSCFDLHQTLLHFLLLSASSSNNSSWASQIRAAMGAREGQSLLGKVPAVRNCVDARVPVQFCCCMEEEQRGEKDMGKLPEDIQSRLHSVLFSHFSSSSSSCPLLLPLHPSNLTIPPARLIRRLRLNPLVRAGIRSPKMERERIAREGPEWAEKVDGSGEDEGVVMELEMNATLKVNMVEENNEELGNTTSPARGTELELHFLFQVGLHRSSKNGQKIIKLLIRGEPMLMRGWRPPIGRICARGKEADGGEDAEEDPESRVLVMGTFCECLMGGGGGNRTTNETK